MATLSAQSISRAGVIPSYAAATGGGDRFLPSKHTYLHVKNGSGGAITVTIATPRTDAWGNEITDNAVSVGAGAEKVIGPFPSEAYGAVADGLADITYSGVTSLTIGAFTIAQP